MPRQPSKNFRAHTLALSLHALFLPSLFLPASLLPQNALAQAGITDLGTLGGPDSVAHAVSANGSVVVGRAAPSGGGDNHAIRWTASGGMQDLGTLGGSGSSARSVSADGSVIVGWAQDNNMDFRAFRWTQAGGMVDLGTLGGVWAMAYDTSANGSVVVGSAQTGSANSNAFRWTQAGGMISLGTLGGSGSAAYGVSADGTVVVGNSQTNGNATTHPFRWTQAGGMLDLGTLPGGSSAYANRVSANGNVVVGYSYINGSEIRAFRWTGGSMYNLGSLGGDSEANGVSADGSVIVGKAGTAQNQVYRGFRWTAATGMQTIEQWLAAAGVQVAQGLSTYDARGVSADGTVVVGELANGRAFIARSSGLIDPQQAQQSVGSTGYVFLPTGISGTSTVVNGAHGRPLSRRVGEGKKAFWLTGDWGRDTYSERDGDFGSAEAGFGYNFGPTQINLSIGQTWSRQSLDLGGRLKIDGNYVLAQALVPLGGQLWATLGGIAHTSDTDVRRVYLNAGLPDSSKGHPDLNTWGLRARVDWEQAFNVLGTWISPYADLTYFRSKLDGYTETGGGFPARFDRRTENTTDLRLGFGAERPMAGELKFVGLLEGVHRFERSGARTTGEIIGLFGFDLDGARHRRNWLHAAVGTEGKLGGGLASLMLNATTRGEAPSYWLSATWQKTF